MSGHSAESDAVRDVLDESLTLSLPLASWALPSCPNYAHVNPDWLRALVAEALRVREVVARVVPDTDGTAYVIPSGPSGAS